MSHIELRHLKTLVALRDTGSLVEAADRVFLTQSALSHQLKGAPLSTNHQRPRERLGKRRGGALTIWIGLFAILFAIALIAVLKIDLNRRANNLNDRVGEMLVEE